MFDICIRNADAHALRMRFQSLQSIFQARNHHKKQKYSAVAEVRRASFTPIIATAEAIFDKEAKIYMKRLPTVLSKKWNSSCPQALCYIRARMQICILRSVSLCLRGSRTKWKGAGITDSASIPLHIQEVD